MRLNRLRLVLAVVAVATLPLSSCQFFGGNPFDFLSGTQGRPRIIPISRQKAAEDGCGDDYQDLLPGHVLSVDHRELDCFRVNVPQGLAAVAIEVRDKSHGEMLQVRVGRKQQNFPSTYDEALTSNLNDGGDLKTLELANLPAGPLYVAITTPISSIMQMFAGSIPFQIRLSFVKFLDVAGQCYPGTCNSGNHFLLRELRTEPVDVRLRTFGAPFGVFASKAYAASKDSAVASVQQTVEETPDVTLMHVSTHADGLPLYVTVTCEANTDASFEICAVAPPTPRWVWLAFLLAYWVVGAALGTVLARPSRRLRPKSLKVAYALWLGFGLLGAHRFYLNRRSTGTVWLFTAAAGGLGWLLDGFLLPTFVLESAKVLQYRQVMSDEEEYEQNVIPMATLLSVKDH